MVEDDQASSPSVNRLHPANIFIFLHATPAPRYGFKASPRDNNPNPEELRDRGRSCGLRFSLQAIP